MLETRSMRERRYYFDTSFIFEKVTTRGARLAKILWKFVDK